MIFGSTGDRSLQFIIKLKLDRSNCDKFYIKTELELNSSRIEIYNCRPCMYVTNITIELQILPKLNCILIKLMKTMKLNSPLGLVWFVHVLVVRVALLSLCEPCFNHDSRC
jgi:hypothetical protein